MNSLPISKTGNIVKVFVIPAFCLPTVRVRSCLNHEELARAAKFKRQEDAERWACYRAALKLTLGPILGISPGDIAFMLSPTGKPELKTHFPTLHFNLSHCDELAVIATSYQCPVGIDIESRHRSHALHECESTFCHPSEIPTLPLNHDERAAALLELWTAKEAALKAIGTGLSNPPEDLVIRRTDGEITAITRDGAVLPLNRLRHPLLDNHSVHLCVLRPVDSIEILSGLPHAVEVQPS